MEITSVVSSQGQVTIPVAVRDLLGLKAGDKVKYKIDKNRNISLGRAETLEEALKRIRTYGKYPKEPLLDVRGYIEKNYVPGSF